MIPFCKPTVTELESRYMLQAATDRICGDGPFTKKATELLKEKLKLETMLLTTSCTHALELAAMLCELQPGDEVILPSFTFASTANAFMLSKANLRLCDISEDTLNANSRHMNDLVTERTKVLAPIDYAGVSCEIDEIKAIANKHNLLIVQDSAQSVGSSYKGRAIGADADFACFSFHETKNYVMGEGGAIAIKDINLLDKCEILREKGTDRSRLFRGEVDKYSWQSIGSSYLPSDILAAMLCGQLERFEEIKQKRLSIFSYYFNSFEELEKAGKLRRPVIPSYCEHNAHIFYILLDSEEQRDNLLSFLRTKGVGAVFHYVPLHLSKVGREIGYQPGDLPVTESAASRLLRLPLFYDLTESELEHIVASVNAFF
ncbi:MAG: dTDP-4-amino-4,6-dideoxygalactose transaminase [Oscillospiraceae bacterium]|nr:dTDP-4-amino-4,6-dideoxygalactose transaminase [Oscillospiraceae bacterium]